MGTRSFGKGTVQELFTIPGDKGMVKMTTSSYYTPDGKSIQAEGITPDVVVNEGLVSYTDSKLEKYRLYESKLRNHLPNFDDKNFASDGRTNQKI